MGYIGSRFVATKRAPRRTAVAAMLKPQVRQVKSTPTTRASGAAARPRSVGATTRMPTSRSSRDSPGPPSTIARRGGGSRFGEQHRCRARGGDDALLALRAERHAHPLEPREVLVAVRPRVVGDVDDPVAGRRATLKDLGHAGHGIAAAVHDTVQIDEKKHRAMVFGVSVDS